MIKSKIKFKDRDVTVVIYLQDANNKLKNPKSLDDMAKIVNKRMVNADSSIVSDLKAVSDDLQPYCYKVKAIMQDVSVTYLK
jgi:hypothetical protein